MSKSHRVADSRHSKKVQDELQEANNSNPAVLAEKREAFNNAKHICRYGNKRKSVAKEKVQARKKVRCDNLQDLRKLIDGNI